MKPSLYERIEVWNERRIETRRLKAKFGQTSDGFKYKGINLQFQPEWEPLTRKLVVDFANHTPLFVNVGAHYGYYVCLAAHHNMSVTAFEPIDANFKMLRDNIAANNFYGQCKLVHGAIGDQTRITKIYGAFSGATLLEEKTTKPKSMFQVTQMFRLSDFQLCKEPTLFLMDVEGYESEVLEGAGGLVEDSTNNSWIIETGGKRLSKIGRRMSNAGYSLFKIGVHKLIELDNSDLDSTDWGGNLLCVNLDIDRLQKLVSKYE